MALIKCYECKGEISDKALSCPRCGAPGKENISTKLGESEHTAQTKNYCELIFSGTMSLEDAELDFCRGIILIALQRTNYVQSKAAKVLGITRRILKYKMDKLGIKALDEEFQEERMGLNHIDEDGYVLKPVKNDDDFNFSKTMRTKFLRLDDDLKDTFRTLIKELSKVYPRKCIKNQYRFKFKDNVCIYNEINKDYIGISIKTYRVNFSDPNKLFEDYILKGDDQQYKYKWIDNVKDVELLAKYIIENLKR